MKVHIGHCNQPNKPSKTEVLFVSAPLLSYVVTATFDNRNLQPIKPANLGNNKFLPVATKFSYLGTNLNIVCWDNEDIVFRIKKAGNAKFTKKILILSAPKALTAFLIKKTSSLSLQSVFKFVPK